MSTSGAMTSVDISRKAGSPYDATGCCARSTGLHAAVEEEQGEALLTVPSIELRLRACDPSEWRAYRAHHYKTQTLSPNARSFALTLEALTYTGDGSSEGVCAAAGCR